MFQQRSITNNFSLRAFSNGNIHERISHFMKTRYIWPMISWTHIEIPMLRLTKDTRDDWSAKRWTQWTRFFSITHTAKKNSLHGAQPHVSVPRTSTTHAAPIRTGARRASSLWTGSSCDGRTKHSFQTTATINVCWAFVSIVRKDEPHRMMDLCSVLVSLRRALVSAWKFFRKLRGPATRPSLQGALGLWGSSSPYIHRYETIFPRDEIVSVLKRSRCMNRRCWKHLMILCACTPNQTIVGQTGIGYPSLFLLFSLSDHVSRGCWSISINEASLIACS